MKRLYLNTYYVTIDGIVTLAVDTSGGAAGRHLLPTLYNKNSVSYFIRDGRSGHAKARAIAVIVKDAFGVDRRFTVDDYHRLRKKAVRANEKLAETQKTNAKKKAAPVPSSRCPFETMKTGCREYPSWDCPEMDPLSCGQWAVATNGGTHARS